MRRAFRVALQGALSALLVAAFGVIGLLVGGGLGLQRAGELLLTPWRRLEAPPEPITRFLLISGDDLFVQAAEGRIYRCCWSVAELPPYPAYPSTHFPCESSLARPTPPGTVVDQIERTYCGADYGIFYQYVLLEDGSVWQWSYAGSGLEAGSTILTYGLCGLGSGLSAGGLAVWGAWRLRRRLTRAQADEQI
jgi:hypothetical protein